MTVNQRSKDESLHQAFTQMQLVEGAAVGQNEARIHRGSRKTLCRNHLYAFCILSFAFPTL